MNTRVLFSAIAITTGLFFTACDNNEETNPRPVINLTEIGYENSKIGYLGTDLHIEAEIVAEGKIDKVTMEIHPENGHAKDGRMTSGVGEWTVDTAYTEFSGLKNATFHKHVDVPMAADTGKYHFHFAVTDMDGQQTIVEEELEIRQPD